MVGPEKSAVMPAEPVAEKREGDRRKLQNRRKSERRSWVDDHWILPPGMEYVSGRRKPQSNRRIGLADRRTGVSERRIGLSERRGHSNARLGRKTDSNVRVMMEPSTFDQKAEGVVSVTGRQRYMAPTYKPPASGQIQLPPEKSFGERLYEIWHKFWQSLGF